MLAWALQFLKLDQHVELYLGGGTAGLWLLLRKLLLLLDTQAKPTSDQQARACACTCGSSERDSQPQAAMHSPIAQQSWRFKVVNVKVEAAKKPTNCLGHCTASRYKQEQALHKRKRPLQVHMLLVQLDLGRRACPGCPHNTNSQVVMLVIQSLHNNVNLLQVAAAP